MLAFTLEILSRMRSKALESISGPMERPMRVNGKPTKCMEEVSSCGKTESAMMASLVTTCGMVKAASNGVMVASTKVLGSKASNTAEVSSRTRKGRLARESGTTERRLGGLSEIMY